MLLTPPSTRFSVTFELSLIRNTQINLFLNYSVNLHVKLTRTFNHLDAKQAQNGCAKCVPNRKQQVRLSCSPRALLTSWFNRVKEIHDDIAYDVDKAKKASFDTFLRLFLSRCLTGDDKDDFEALQQRIEKLQIERYNDAALRQTTRDALEETQRQASADGDNPAPASAEEIDLVGARDKLLNGVVDKCLSKVLGLAKDDEMQALLRTL